MQKLDPSYLVSALCLVGVTSFLVGACSTSGGDVTPQDADGGTLADGAPAPGDAEPPKACTKDEECPSGVCNLATKLCEPASCTDGIKNSSEPDIDCGGPCKPCADLKSCAVAADCTSGVCTDAGSGLKCQVPTLTDGTMNGLETGIDCGGSGNPKCPDGQGCKGRDDCTSDYCNAGVCSPVKADDGIQNGKETDIDCGGEGAKRCADGKKCLVDGDCTSDVCKNLNDGMGLRCQVPTPTDGHKNGTETDVDCGGGGANPACAVGLGCLVSDDCTSLGCDYNKKCALGRSCTSRYGGDTCGFGGAGSVGPAMWESCCAKAAVTATTGPTAGAAVQVDKYAVTAGRMRVFMEAVGYDVRAFVQAARTAGKIPTIPGDAGGRLVLDAAWDPYLPTSFAGNTNVDEIADCSQGDETAPGNTICKPGTLQAGIYTSVAKHVGGFIFKGNNQPSTGCYIGTAAGGGGTHTFRFPDGMQDGPGVPAADQNEYDTKAMQCVDYLVAQAFCVWDGGRLVMGQEWVAAWGPGAMPWQAETAQTPAEPGQRCDGATCLTGGDKTYWGCRFPWALDASHPQCGLTWPASTTIEYADYKYSYEYPKLGAPNAWDYVGFIAAPGRTRGRGPAGHADIIGTHFNLTSNVVYDADPQVASHGWTNSGSWEVHSYSKPATGIAIRSGLLNKYGKLGLRCAYP